MLPTSFLRSKSFPLVLSVSCTTEYCPLTSMVSCGSTGSSLVCLCPFCTTEYTAFGSVLRWEPGWREASDLASFGQQNTLHLALWLNNWLNRWLLFGSFWFLLYHRLHCIWLCGLLWLNRWLLFGSFGQQNTLHLALWSALVEQVAALWFFWTTEYTTFGSVVCSG